MIAIALITFRESLEMYFVGSIVFATLRESKINKQKDLIFGIILGLLFSIFLFIIVTFASSQIHFNISKEFSEIIESLNYLGSGVFLFITAILLHNKMRSLLSHGSSILLDTSLFAIGFLLVIREGIEIVLFSISTSILSSFFSSISGFIFGLIATLFVSIVGNKIAQSYLPHKKMFVAVDWAIKLLSFYFILKGVIGLSEFIF